MGSIIQKPDKTYAIRFEIPDSLGKRKRKYISGFKTKKEAEKALILAENDVMSFNTHEYTFKQVSDIWLEDHVSVFLSPKTHVFYENILSTHILPYIGKMKFNAIETRDINALYKKLKNAGKSNDIIKKVHATLRAIFYKAYSWNMSNEKIMDKIKLEKPKAPVHTFWDANDIKQALDLFENFSLIFHIKVALNLGLREGEICGLMYDDIDFIKKELHVTRTVQYDKNAEKFANHKGVHYIKDNIIVKDPKSDSAKRTIPLTDEMLSLFKKRMTEISKNKIFLGEKYNNEWIGFFSVNEDGTLINTNQVCRRFADRINRTPGIKKVTFHELRHSCASWLLDNDVDMRIIQEILGHSDMSVTSKIYSHLTENKKREAMSRLKLPI